MAKKKRKRVYLNIDDKPVYDPDRAFEPYNPFSDGDGEKPQFGLDGLTLKQRLFVDAYTGPAAGSVKEAAYMAGYGGGGKKGERTHAHYVAGDRTLRLPHVQEAIAHALAKQKMSEEWTKLTLFELANCNLGNFVDITEDGDWLKFNFRKAMATGSMRQLKSFDSKNGKISVHDPIAALTILAKFYNMIRDTVPDETANDLPLDCHPLNGRVSSPAGMN